MILSSVISCKENSNKSFAKISLNRRINVIDSLPMISGNKFFNNEEKKELFSKRLKIIAVINGYCEFCFSQLQIWKDSIITSNVIDTSRVAFLFYIHSSNYIPFNCYLSSIDFRYPIIYDTNNYFAKVNNIPNDNLQNNMLLYNDSICIIGNPILRPRMKKVYIDYLNSVSE